MLEQRIERGEELLKQLSAELNIIKTKTLPDTFARANTPLHKVADGDLKGWKIEIQPRSKSARRRTCFCSEDQRSCCCKALGCIQINHRKQGEYDAKLRRRRF